MKDIIKEYRAYLQTLIEAEQHRLGLDTKAMLNFLQSHVALPDFYRVPAQAAAEDILMKAAADYPGDTLSEALQEAIKAVYGAWIRERFREV